MNQRDRIILRALQRPHISYQQIGDRFNITRERVRQIRERLIRQGEIVPPRSPKNPKLIQLLQNGGLTYGQLEEITGISRQQLSSSASWYRQKGMNIPRRSKEDQRPTIIHMLLTDTKRKYGRCKRIARQLGVTTQYVRNTVCQAKRDGLL